MALSCQEAKRSPLLQDPCAGNPLERTLYDVRLSAGLCVHPHVRALDSDLEAQDQDRAWDLARSRRWRLLLLQEGPGRALAPRAAEAALEQRTP